MKTGRYPSSAPALTLTLTLLLGCQEPDPPSHPLRAAAITSPGTVKLELVGLWATWPYVSAGAREIRVYDAPKLSIIKSDSPDRFRVRSTESTREVVGILRGETFIFAYHDEVFTCSAANQMMFCSNREHGGGQDKSSAAQSFVAGRLCGAGDTLHICEGDDHAFADPL